MTYGDVMDMNVDDALWFHQRLSENREAESAAIKAANSNPG